MQTPTAMNTTRSIAIAAALMALMTPLTSSAYAAPSTVSPEVCLVSGGSIKMNTTTNTAICRGGAHDGQTVT
jgi:hypothetical protein